jgi:hypothetical protein
MEETEEKDILMSRTDSEFAVLTQDKDCHIVTQELGIKPERFHQKGEKTYSKFSQNPGIRQSGLWAISKVSVAEGACISEHIKHFQSVLGDKLEVIEKLKHHYGFECVFHVLIHTEDAGESFDLDEAELSFINKISNRFTCSIIAIEGNLT